MNDFNLRMMFCPTNVRLTVKGLMAGGLVMVGFSSLYEEGHGQMNGKISWV